MSFFQPAEPKRNREDGDASQRPTKRGYLSRPKLNENQIYMYDGGRLHCLSPDGSKAIKLLPNNTFELYEVASQALLMRFEGHSQTINSVAISPDNTKIVTGAGSYMQNPHDNTVRIWDVRSGSCIHILEGHLERVTAVCFSPDGTKIISGSVRGSDVRLWNAISGAAIASFNKTTDGVLDWQYSDDLRSFRFRPRDPQGPRILRVYSLTFSPDNTKIAVSADCVYLFNIANRQCIDQFVQYGILPDCMAFSPDNTKVAFAYMSKVRVWTPRTHQQARVVKYMNYNARRLEFTMKTLSFSADGTRLASGGDDREVNVFDVESGELLHTFTGHAIPGTRAVMSACFVYGGTHIIAASNQCIILFALPTSLFPWVREATNMLRAFAHNPQYDAVNAAGIFTKQVKDKYPGFFDSKSRLYKIDVNGEVKAMNGREVLEWLEKEQREAQGSASVGGSSEEFTELKF